MIASIAISSIFGIFMVLHLWDGYRRGIFLRSFRKKDPLAPKVEETKTKVPYISLNGTFAIRCPQTSGTSFIPPLLEEIKAEAAALTLSEGNYIVKFEFQLFAQPGTTLPEVPSWSSPLVKATINFDEASNVLYCKLVEVLIKDSVTWDQFSGVPEDCNIVLNKDQSGFFVGCQIIGATDLPKTTLAEFLFHLPKAVRQQVGDWYKAREN